MANASHNQLEIIGPGGRIEFYELDPGKGVTNIGRHPENDIVIDSPTVAPFTPCWITGKNLITLWC